MNIIPQTVLALGLLLAPLSVQAQDQAPAAAPAVAPADAEAKYQALLAAAKAGTGPVDWKALRYADADRPSYVPDAPDPNRVAMIKATDRRDWLAMLDLAQKVIDKNYLDARAHETAAAANEALGHADAAKHELDIAIGLFSSMRTGSGLLEGLSYDTAYAVIAVREEYDVLNMRHRIMQRQRLDMHGGHTYDVLDVTDEAGQSPETYYFQIDRVWAAETRMFTPH